MSDNNNFLLPPMPSALPPRCPLIQKSWCRACLFGGLLVQIICSEVEIIAFQVIDSRNCGRIWTTVISSSGFAILAVQGPRPLGLGLGSAHGPNLNPSGCRPRIVGIMNANQSSVRLSGGRARSHFCRCLRPPPHRTLDSVDSALFPR